MAKKLNKKIAYSLLTLLVVCIAGGSVVGLRMWRERNPEYSLDKAREAFKNQDFPTAEQFFGKAYAYTKHGLGQN